MLQNKPVSTFFRSPAPACLLVLFLGVPGARAAIQYDSSHRSWILVSGPVEYRLQQKAGSVSFEYFGPRGFSDWTPHDAGRPEDNQSSASVRSDISGQVEGQDLSASSLNLISHQTISIRPGVDELELVFEHRRLPLRITTRYYTWGDTGVITRRLLLENTGKRVQWVRQLPSLSWNLPSGEYELTYLWGGWGQERQVATERLQAGARRFVSSRGRSTNGYSPWFSLKNESEGVRYLAQLAYSGNWELNFERLPLSGDRPFWANQLAVRLGMRFDYGGALRLEPSQSFSFPEVAFTSSAGDLDTAANQLHRYQQQYVIPRNPVNDPLLVQFNSWYPFPGKMTVSEMKRCADLAAQIGAEVYVLDAGWYNKTDWSTELGDYQADREAFPNGIHELANHVRKLGMKFGIWVEIENVGINSNIFREHPDWCLQYDGAPIERDKRRQLNFAKPEVRRWARSVVDRLVQNYGIEWLKIDYNIDIGEQFDPPETDRRPGDVLYRHLMNYYAWLDEVRAAYPRVVIENCSSGGLRFDLGIMAHANTTWLSDEVRPMPSVQLAYGCTLEFTPKVCNHWMVGDTDHGDILQSDQPQWWDFMFRVPMNGQFGLSSKVFTWSPVLVQHASENVALYKKLRSTIGNADVYHLTPPTAHVDPVGWTAIQYVSRDSENSVLMAYRLAQSGAEQTFKLRGLRPEAKFRLETENGPIGTWTGRDLMHAGLRVRLDEVWRATAIRIEPLQ